MSGKGASASEAHQVEDLLVPVLRGDVQDGVAVLVCAGELRATP
eukprot:COSAG03_NODE_3826_length_1812_cov_1.395213_2_plen_44_part_00